MTFERFNEIAAIVLQLGDFSSLSDIEIVLWIHNYKQYKQDYGDCRFHYDFELFCNAKCKIENEIVKRFSKTVLESYLV